MVNIVICCAGRGSRFQQEGYKDPKPFILINQKPMIELVIDNLNGNIVHEDYRYILIFLEEFKEKYEKIIDEICQKYCKNYNIIWISDITGGAAETALYSKSIINNDEELILTDCDHIVEDDNHLENGLKYFRKNNADAGFFTFISNDIKYSYLKINGKRVLQVAEKEIIGPLANNGSYYWKSGKSYICNANRMILNNDRVKNEFYVSNVLNYNIANGDNVMYFITNTMIGLGTPRDLKEFLKDRKIQHV